jgi:hypothetical protein
VIQIGPRVGIAEVVRQLGGCRGGGIAHGLAIAEGCWQAERDGGKQLESRVRFVF